MIKTIEVVGKSAIIDRQLEQPGDVPQTWADVTKAKKLFGYLPSTSFITGVEQPLLNGGTSRQSYNNSVYFYFNLLS